jgi:hypothetical protein
MRRILIALALIGGFMAAADVAVAQYYTYEPGYYPPPPKRYYRQRHYGYRPYVPPTDPYGRQWGRHNPNAGCPLGYTVQSGVCKPYRGY